MSFLVGLTGGIGSGKSTVAEAFVALGAGLVDTDALARQLTDAGGLALAPLQAAFGPDIIGPDGALDRAVMRQRVFADETARRQLEASRPPRSRAEAAARVAASTAPYVLLDVPLLVETGVQAYGLDRVLVVDCPESLQLQRVMGRSALSAPEVQAVMAAQASRAARLAVADDVLDNSGAPDCLGPAVARLHEAYLEMAARKTAARDLWVKTDSA